MKSHVIRIIYVLVKTLFSNERNGTAKKIWAFPTVKKNMPGEKRMKGNHFSLATV